MATRVTKFIKNATVYAAFVFAFQVWRMRQIRKAADQTVNDTWTKAVKED